MISPDLLSNIRKEISEAIGEEKIFWKKSDLAPYTKDSCCSVLDKEYEHLPDLVALPETTEDVRRVVEIAAEHKIPLIPKGGGSNRAGMLVPIHKGIIVDVIKMKKIIELDTENFSVTVQPGITLKELEGYLSPHGFSLHQEQGSLKVATVGGAISTSGFSRKHQKYGTIANRVMSLEVVLADGSVLRTSQKVLYTSTGYRLNHLFIGAEGSLGIITEATLRIEPVAEAKDAIIAFYEDFWDANSAAKKLMASSVTFAGAELQELENGEELGAPSGRNVVLFVFFEGTEEEVKAEVEYVKNLLEQSGGILGKRDMAIGLLDSYEDIWCGTRAIDSGFRDELNPYIPMDRLREFYDRLWNEILPKYNIEIVPGEKYDMDVGRFSMAYSQLLIPEGKNQKEKFRKARREISQLVAELGGSISSCIGVGLAYNENLDLEYSEVALDVMKSIKKTLDPNNIMNPGKKIAI